MARTVTLLVTGLLLVGSIVALLPAQETSSRRRSRYGTAAAAPAALPTTTTPGSDAAPQSLAERLRAAGQQATQEYSPTANDSDDFAGEDPAEQMEPAESDASDYPAEESESPSDTSLRSVLKRPQPSLVDEAAPPRFSPIPPGGAAGDANGMSSRRNLPAARPTGSGSVRGLALSGHSSSLRVDVAGPPAIAVGKPADYVVTLSNDSEAAAEDAQVRLELPGWVSVTGSQASAGQAGMQADPAGLPRLVWSIPALAGKSREQLKLQVVTAEGDSFELGVEWASRPATARAAITVKQPQLEVALAGPGEMNYGETKAYTLTVSNPGTGDAEQVVVNLSTGDGRSQPIDAGNIPAGHKKQIPLEVVANQAGEMQLHATANGDGGLTAQTTGKVLVRKAELNIAADGPPLKFAGAEAAYLVTVTNTGNAPAEQVQLAITLPAGAKYLGGIDGATATAGNLKWKLTSLPVGSERQYEVRVQLQAAGLNRLVVQATASAAGTANAQAETEVEAISDLKLVVNDPAGPVATEDETVYEVQVTNRGSQAAEQVKIVVQFAEGIEPIAFEGCQARIVPGQVLCQPLASLGAGEQITLRIKAKAAAAGTHQFRVEVTGADAGTRLVSEGTTRFFSETGRMSAAARTAERPALLPKAGTIQR